MTEQPGWIDHQCTETVTIQSDVEVCESTLYETIDGEGRFSPAVSVVAKLPSGRYTSIFPMLSLPFWNDTDILNVVTIEHGPMQWDATVRGYYGVRKESDDGPDELSNTRVVETTLTDDDVDIRTVAQQSVIEGEISWDRRWTETTDPTADIAHPDDDYIEYEDGVE